VRVDRDDENVLSFTSKSRKIKDVIALLKEVEHIFGPDARVLVNDHDGIVCKRIVINVKMKNFKNDFVLTSEYHEDDYDPTGR
jgi:hypothetical protein